MYKSQYQNNLLSIFYSIGSNPFENWGLCSRSGSIKRKTDEDLKSYCVEILDSNTATCYMQSPPPCSKYKSLVIIIDHCSIKRRFKATNFTKFSKISHSCCTIPLNLEKGWNCLMLDLEHFTRKAFNTQYVECLEIKIHANCRLRRIFFSANKCEHSELPFDYRINPNECKKQALEEKKRFEYYRTHKNYGNLLMNLNNLPITEQQQQQQQQHEENQQDQKVINDNIE